MQRSLTLAFLLASALFLACAAFVPTSSPAPTSARDAAAYQYSYGEFIHVRGVPHAGKVSDRLYRGAQPYQQGIVELKKMGVTTIVNLRLESKARIAREQKTAESLGLRFVHIPVNGWAPPTDEQVAQFLALFRDDAQAKVFVHCHLGDDRTGVFVATYRMVYDRFPADEALKEMNVFGFNHSWHPSMSTYVREFPQHLASSPALAPFKANP